MTKAVAIHLDEDVLMACLAELPPTALKKGFVEYSSANFKLAPRWEEMKPYQDFLRALLTAADGRARILHSSFFKGILAWAKKEGLEISDGVLESGCYKLRAMLSQMANHKSKGRGVPVRFRRFFQPLFNMIDCSQRPPEDEEVQIVRQDAPAAPDIEVVSSTDDEPADHANLFVSTDPDLQKLLSEHRPRLFKKTKKDDCLYPYPPLVPKDFEGYSGIDLVDLLAVDQPVVDPKAFAKLNAKLKADRIEKQKAAAAKKGKKNKSPMKGTPALKTTKTTKAKGEHNTSEAKRMHSKIYHAKMAACKKEGKSKQVCKAEARAAAKVGMAEWRAALAALGGA